MAELNLAHYVDVLGQLPRLKTYSHLLLVFPLPDGQSPAPLIDSIESAAQDVRNAFPWLACRVLHEGSGPGNSGVFRLATCPEFGFPNPVVRRKDCTDNFPTYQEIIDAHGPVAMLDGNILAMGVKLSPFKPASTDTTAVNNRTCYSIEWHPDINFITLKEIQKLLPKSSTPPETYDAQLEWFSQLQLASTLLATDGLVATRGVKDSVLQNHHRQYTELLRRITANVAIDNMPYVSLEMWLSYSRNPALKKQLYQKIQNRNAEGALLVQMGSNIASILEQKITSQDLLFENANLFSAWDDFHLSRGDVLPVLTQYFSLLSKSQRSLRILEVGGRTGALSEHVLKTLCGDNNKDSIEHYVISPQSVAHSEIMKKRLAAWRDVIKYETVDSATKPSEQELPPNSFDLVIANDYIGGQSNVEDTIVRLNAMIRPGGRLLILEEVRPNFIHGDITFGSLPGWWDATEASRYSETFTDKLEWDRCLRKVGFSGIDLEASSSTYPEFAGLSLMASTASNRALETTIPPLKAIIIVDSHSEISRLLTTKLLSAGVHCSVCRLDDLHSEHLTSRVCISLLEAEQPILNTMSSTTFQKIQNLITACDSLLWVSGDSLTQPQFQMATGLLRTIRWEQDRNDLNLVTFSLSSEIAASMDADIDALVRVFVYQFLNQVTRDSNGTNAEYRIRDSLIETNRIIKNTEASTVIEGQFSTPTPILSPWENIQRPVRLISTAPGLDHLTWVTDEDISEKPLSPLEIEIEVHAVGLNFKDLLVAMGEIDQPGFGHEAAGFIVSVGSSVKHFKTGDM